MNRIHGSCTAHLLALAVVLGGVTGCSHEAKPESASTAETQPAAAAVEAPPPPEPASALGSASGSLRMVDFANEKEFYAYDSDHSDANLAKSQGHVAEEFRSSLAYWKAGSQSLVIYLLVDTLNANEAAQIKTSIVNGSDAMQKRSATAGQVVFATVTFKSSPPSPGNQDVSVILSSRGSNGRFYSASGSGKVQVSSLPVKASWAKPGRLLPEIELRAKGKSHYGESSFGSSEWRIETRVPVIYTTGR